MNFIDKELFEKYAGVTRTTFNYNNEISILATKYKKGITIQEHHNNHINETLKYETNSILDNNILDWRNNPDYNGIDDPNYIIFIDPIGQTPEESISLFYNYYGRKQFLSQLRGFLERYSNLQKKLLEAKLDEINPIIEKSNQSDFIRYSFRYPTANDKAVIICRLINGYYDNKLNYFQYPGYLEFAEEYGILVFVEFAKYIIEKENKITLPEKKLPSFESLFRNPDNANRVKKIFEDNYYTTGGKWTHTGDKNILATAYYVLSDPEPLGEIHAIKPDTTETQLTVFYNEFGLKISEKSGPEIYSTIRNLTKRPGYDVNEKRTYREFVKLFAEFNSLK